MADVTLVTATWQSRRRLQEFVSANRRALKKVQWIVQDGGSTDGTVEYMEDVCRALGDAHFASKADSGVYDAWNSAVSRATGDWVLFYGDDDIISEEWIDVLRHQPAAVRTILVADLKVVHPGNGRAAVIRGWQPRTREEVLNRTALPHVGMAHSRDFFSESAFDPRFKIAGDREFLLRAWPFEVKYIAGVSQGVMKLGGLSNSPAAVARSNAEAKEISRLHDVPLSWKRQAAMVVKATLATIPQLFRITQGARWRLFGR
jgi:glycosyltransferase involved in cell wall biosynthesis